MEKDHVKRLIDAGVVQSLSLLTDQAVRECLAEIHDELMREYSIRDNLLDNGWDIYALSTGEKSLRLYEQRRKVRAALLAYLDAASRVSKRLYGN